LKKENSHMSPVKLLGERIKSAREEAKMTLEELSTLATLSKNQLQQIEEGGDSSFYSAEIKLIAAKKVGKILKLDDSEFLISE
jgi:transcriptional regulator with XRE-family HTH domain